MSKLQTTQTQSQGSGFNNFSSYNPDIELDHIEYNVDFSEACSRSPCYGSSCTSSGEQSSQKALQQTLAWAKKSSIKNTQQCLRIQLDLAEAYGETKESTKVIQLAENGLAFQEKHLLKDGSSVLAVSCALAKVHRFNGAPKKEIDRLEKLKKLGTKRSALERLALLAELGKCYSSANEYDKAAENQEMGIEVVGNKLTKDDPILIVVKNHLAYAYAEKGQHNEAISILEKTIPIQEGNLGKSHSGTLITRSYLANEYLATKELTKAISVLEELVPLQRKTLGKMNKETMFSDNQLAEAYFSHQNVYTALKLYEHMCVVRQNLDQNDEQKKWAEAGYQKCAETWKWTWMRR